jgi:glycosyltransferase involved in cell wall biosynthesis
MGLISFIVSKLNQFKDPELTVIGVDFMGPGGAWKSVWEMNHQMRERKIPTNLINRNRRKTRRKVLGSALFAKKIIINGLDTFHYWDCILLALLRKDSLVYLHETKYMVDSYQHNSPLKFRLIEHILANRKLLCVSKQASRYYKERFRTRETTVVYETVSENTQPVLDEAKVNIVMVGSIDQRKGAELFAKTAILAENLFPEWCFTWVGAGNATLLKDSPVVTMGWQKDPVQIIEKASLFFLSSVDDPFPLACIEALQHGIPCVVYKDTGTSELLGKEFPQCVYEDYTPESALEAIRTSLLQKPDPQLLKELYNEKLSPQVFTTRMLSILDIVDLNQSETR